MNRTQNYAKALIVLLALYFIVKWAVKKRNRRSLYGYYVESHCRRY
ncbi:DUF6019 family protein [Jutongia hominis]|nr:DUF6019 family protein [Lachnospiraceae bacterium]